MNRVELGPETDPADVIARFLTDMRAAAERTYPAWRNILVEGISDIAPEGSALYEQLLTHQPLEDFYFAGVVALEAAKIRRYLGADSASALLAELGAQVDRAAGRPDRAVSDLVFIAIGRIEVEAGPELMTMPYDKAVHVLLQRIGLDRDEATRPLMGDFAFRHGLGEPLARGVPAWWKTFAAKAQRRAEAAKQAGRVALAAE